jgi:hypothetical protein
MILGKATVVPEGYLFRYYAVSALFDRDYAA